MAHEYASIGELLSWETVADTDDNPSMAIALEAASRQIDRYCGRRFWLDDTATPRYFSPLRDGSVPVADIGDAAGVLVAVDQGANGSYWQAWTVDVDFFLAPRDAAAAGEPWTELRFPTWGTKRWPCGEDSVRVTARWGWPAIPADIKQATLIQAARLLKRKDSPLGVAGETGVSVARIANLDPDAEALVAMFRLLVVA